MVNMITDLKNALPCSTTAVNCDCPGSILLIIETPCLGQELRKILQQHRFNIFEDVFNPSLIFEYVQKKHPVLLILESPLNKGIETLDVVKKLRQLEKRFPIILVTTYGSEALAISALRTGVKDYFTPPIPKKQFISSVDQCISNYRSRTALMKVHCDNTSTIQDQQLIGDSFQICRVKAYLQKLASVDSHVLITGETGTGKELTAQYIHEHSLRHNKPFIAINCAAIPDGLLESELFGYEKGAFTGANAAYAGKLKLAEGGTVFFDEIGDMSPYAQAKILRVIESKEVYPLGAKRSVPLNIRIIAATNCDLESMVSKKEFRQDLYFRLNVARVQLPPLRDRKEDIECLVDYYLQLFNRQFSQNILGLTNEAWELLHHYDWPGNIRELKNFLEAVYIDPPSDRISANDLSDLIHTPCHLGKNAQFFERELLLSTLNSVHWNKSKAAEQLHWSRMTLYRKMAKHNIVASIDES